MEKSIVLSEVMSVIIKHVDKPSFLNLLKVSKDINTAVKSCSDVFWEKNKTVQYLMQGKITPSGIPCCVQRLIQHVELNYFIYTFDYIPLPYGESAGQIYRAFWEFIEHFKRLEISVIIMTREEHYLYIKADENCRGSIYRFQCIHTTRGWQQFYMNQGVVRDYSSYYVKRVIGLRRLISDECNTSTFFQFWEFPAWKLNKVSCVEIEFNNVCELMTG